MLISLNWLGKYVDLDGVETGELIRLIGARLVEVEGVVDQRKKYDNIFVVKVVGAERIPDTHLTLCKIDDGGVAAKIARDADGLVQVMCGAPNVRAGMLAAWIAPGAVVPASVNEDAPFVIGTRKMLGKYESHGMLAGADELDFGGEHKAIAEISPDDGRVGMPFGELFGLSDIILEIENKSLTHRPDCFGMIGFAREVAGILGQKFETPEWLMDFGEKDFAAKGVDLKVKLESSEICPRYTALVMERRGEEKVRCLGEMETLLARSGMRPISPLVDVTNYLMLLTGQPLHAFDYDKLVAVGGKKVPEIVVRLAREGEELELLDGRKIELVGSDVVITSSGVPVALAGAMGGRNTEIDEGTRKVIVESATFSLYNLRKTQMVHGIFSEAITRFTKGQAAGQTLPVVKEFARMMAGGMGVVALVDEYPGGGKKNVVKVTTGFINGLLGTDYGVDLVKKTLENVGFGIVVENPERGFDENGAGVGPSLRATATSSSLPSLRSAKPHQSPVPDFVLRCTVPYWRTDIGIPEDVVEEVGRLLGYDNILPRVPLHGTAGLNAMFELKGLVREVLVGAGANEVLSYSFVHGDLLGRVGQDLGDSYRIVNSLSPDLQYVRQRVVPSLLVKAGENLKAGYDEFGLFEMNQVFLRGAGMDDEGVPVLFNNLGFVYADREGGGAFYRAKKYLMYLVGRLGVEVRLEVIKGRLPRVEAFYEPKRSAKIMVGGRSVGVIGEIRRGVAHVLKLPAGVAAFEVGLDDLMGEAGKVKKDFAVSQYPSVGRDLTLAVKPSVSYEKVEGKIASVLEGEKLIYKIVPMAIYRAGAEEELKMSFHLEFAAREKTLTNKEIRGIMEKLEKLSNGGH